MLLLRSGLRFSIWALEVPEPRVRKMPLSLSLTTFTERLDVDWALLQVDGVLVEVHLTTDVEVHLLGKAHHVVVVHPK